MSQTPAADDTIDLRSPDQAEAWMQKAKSFETDEYKADWGLAGMNASYAYALGFTGKGVKLGEVDSGIHADHSEFKGGRIHPLDIKGSYANDGYRYEWAGWRWQNRRWEWVSYGPRADSAWKAGDAFDTPGVFNGKYNDPHGTHVGGTIAANRDGKGMHGVAYESDLYVANTGGTDASLYGPQGDYNYYKAAYGAVAASGARAINSSWGNSPASYKYSTLAGVTNAYKDFFGKKTHVDAMLEVSQATGTIQVLAAGNDYAANPDVRNSLPYFRPEAEKYWISVGAAANWGKADPASLGIAGFSDRGGIAKYWLVFAPGQNIYSSVPPFQDGDVWNTRNWGVDPKNQRGYSSVSGTSMSAPHATGALGVIMERYAYLDNQGARDVLLTTARHRDAVEGTPDDTTGLARNDAPNAVWGWGTIDLKAAMDGPGQFLGAFTVDMTKAQSDTWHNSITEDALIQRKREDAAEQAVWAETLKQKGWDVTPPTAASSIDDQLAYAVGTARATAAAERVYQGSLVKNGEGTLALAGAGSTYSGGTFLNGGTLALAAAGAAGTGAIRFGAGAQTLQIDVSALQADETHALGNVIEGFAGDGDVIDFKGVGAYSIACFDDASDTLKLLDPFKGGACGATLKLSGDYRGKVFHAASDGQGGVAVSLFDPMADLRTNWTRQTAGTAFDLGSLLDRTSSELGTLLQGAGRRGQGALDTSVGQVAWADRSADSHKWLAASAAQFA